MAAPQGGVDRRHDPSLRIKLVFATLHGAIILIALWLAFGPFDWADPTRARILAGCALLYWLRHLVTLFVLMQRRVVIAEALGLSAFMAFFELGFLLLGAGFLSGTATPLTGWDGAGAALLLTGSYLNTGSELQRRAWKQQPGAKGHCYTGGLFAYSMHINYFGDTMLFTGWAMLTASLWAFSIPLLMAAMFVFYHIPPLDAYLAERYGAEFRAYAKRTARFVPFIY